MKTEVNTISAVVAAALGALLSYCVQLVIPLIVLILVMLLDYATGMTKAWIRGELCSRIGVRGILFFRDAIIYTWRFFRIQQFSVSFN